LLFFDLFILFSIFDLKCSILFSYDGTVNSIFLLNLDNNAVLIEDNLLVAKNINTPFNEFLFIQSISCNNTEIKASLFHSFHSVLFGKRASASSKNIITLSPFFTFAFASSSFACMAFSEFHSHLSTISVHLITINSQSILLAI